MPHQTRLERRGKTGLTGRRLDRPVAGMRIIDCFTFFNEVDLLRLRVEELKDCVDRFVLIEANRSHSGSVKPRYFQENREQFADVRHRISCHEADLSHITGDDRWLREQTQRDVKWSRETEPGAY